MHVNSPLKRGNVAAGPRAGRNTVHKGVSLIELIIALVILALLAALAIPRFSRAAAQPDEGAILRAHLKVLRVAIERYYQDHDVFPGCHADGLNPAGSEAAFIAQLTKFSDERGRVNVAAGPRA
ncbi:MAG: prepilin-type N-terminal cleavage/methylation domain-containing protein, partial [Phycisphaerae bacterium]|nr:prepilin-type N-terminal cleavage/methylation domain-containing protein [Phycisphaerae bacterium]